MVRLESLGNGRWKTTPLANFNARILRDRILDDCAEQHRSFGMEAEVGGQMLTLNVSAAEFSRMS